ncbi:MAG: YdcH family protein [Stellaceae bacterium]
MTAQDQIEDLRAKHRSLEEAIHDETDRPLPDTERVADWKRQKLRIKDQIAQIEHPH